MKAIFDLMHRAGLAPVAARKEFLLVVAGQFVSFVGAIVGVKVLTQVLAPEQYGLLALALTVITLFQQVVFSPSLGAASRFYSFAIQSGQTREYLRGLSYLSLIAITIVAVSVWPSVIIIRRLGPAYLSLLIPTTGLIMLTAINSLCASIQAAARQRGAVAFHDASGQWLRGGFAWLFISLSSGSAIDALWGHLTACIFVISSQLFFLVRLLRGLCLTSSHRPPGETLTVSSMWGFAWPYSLWGSFFWLGVASERWALKSFQGLASVGVYQAAYQMGYSPLALCLAGVQSFVTPIIFERVGDGSDPITLRHAHTLALQFAIGSVLLACILAVIAIAAGPFFYHRLTGAAYASGASLLPVALLSAGFFGAAQFLSQDYLNARRSQRLLYPKLAAAIAASVFVWIGAMTDGSKGVFIGTLLSNVLYLALVWLFSPARPSHRLDYKLSRILNKSCRSN